MDCEVAWEFINDYLIMIWNIERLALHCDLGFLSQSITNWVYYVYMYIFMWEIYGRLQIDIWIVDHRCDRITYIRFELWIGYPDTSIGLWPRRYGWAFPNYLGLTTHNRGIFHHVISILLLCIVGIYVIHSFLLLSLSLPLHDLTCLYLFWYCILISNYDHVYAITL